MPNTTKSVSECNFFQQTIIKFTLGAISFRREDIRCEGTTLMQLKLLRQVAPPLNLLSQVTSSSLRERRHDQTAQLLSDFILLPTQQQRLQVDAGTGGERDKSTVGLVVSWSVRLLGALPSRS
ncbi:hypothetical protein PINS_up000695 [Pythium insidiosum]|nr:hypothetical protein PINS_up000695 [Pythium insidiosum]